MIAVRAHLYVAAALLVAGVPLSGLVAFRVGMFPVEAHAYALLGGMTLFAQAIAFWYLPSFAKREVVLDGIAAYSGPILLPAATLAAALGSRRFGAGAAGLALALFALVLLASALGGPKWRGGVPFWRASSPHRAGDRAAAATLAASAVWMLAGGALAVYRPPSAALMWPTALALFALGALAHLLPRARALPLRPEPFLLATIGLQLGVLALLFMGPGPASRALLLGLPLAGVALALPLRGKRPGARLREARLPLLAALAMSSAAGIVGLAQPATSLGAALTTYYLHVGGIVAALAGLSLLTLPVLFNQRPAPRYLLPAALTAVGGAALLAAGFLTPLPRGPGAVVMGVALLLWLASLWPLRRPRRACAVDRIAS